MRLALAFAAASVAFAQSQTFEQRGFLESGLTLYPQTGANDSGRAIGEALFRYEVTWRPKSWLKLSGSFDARFDTHQQVDRDPVPDFEDRRIRRPALGLRRLSAIVHKGNVTVEVGKQFIRWGKTDLLTPTDRFAPKDFLSVSTSDFLPVTAARATWDNGTDTVDLVWQVRFTPSRAPLINQRWTVLPPEASGVTLVDEGARYPGGAAEGLRWNHNGRGYELALTFYNGFNHLPLFDVALLAPAPPTVGLTRYYPELRQYGGATAVPLRWFTVKAEAAYYSSSNAAMDEFVLYVIQVERTHKEWVFVGGYGGDASVRDSHNPLIFTPDRGLARSFLGRASYNWDANTTLSFDAAIRQNGAGSLVRFEYTRAIGQHWRATGNVSWLHGDPSDFLGQYHRNSSASIAIRYSF